VTGCVTTQVEVAETSEATAQASYALTQLSVLLPGHGLLFGKASGRTACQEAAVKAAGKQGASWSRSSDTSLKQVILGCTHRHRDLLSH